MLRLRFSAGLTTAEIARSFDISRFRCPITHADLVTAEPCWIYARIWLHADLADGRRQE
jgi:hypothetical protein